MSTPSVQFVRSPGSGVGSGVGFGVGSGVGSGVGRRVGAGDGCDVGLTVGSVVGLGRGSGVGTVDGPGPTGSGGRGDEMVIAPGPLPPGVAEAIGPKVIPGAAPVAGFSSPGASGVAVDAGPPDRTSPGGVGSDELPTPALKAGGSAGGMCSDPHAPAVAAEPRSGRRN